MIGIVIIESENRKYLKVPGTNPREGRFMNRPDSIAMLLASCRGIGAVLHPCFCGLCRLVFLRTSGWTVYLYCFPQNLSLGQNLSGFSASG